MEEEKEKKYRISSMTGGLMVITAVFYDLIEFFLDWLGIGLVLNLFVGVFAGLHLWFWFRLKDVDFMGSFKRFGVNALANLAELIPALDGAVIGAFHTVGVIILLVMVRIEDKTGMKVPMPGGKTSAPTIASVKQQTMAAGRRNLERQRLRTPDGASRANNRPTLESTVRNNMKTSAAVLKRRSMDVRRKGGNIG